MKRTAPEYGRVLYEKLRAAGLCTKCRRRAAPDRAHCDDCLYSHRVAQRARAPQGGRR